MNKPLVGNRDEMALGIIRTAKAEGILTVAIYTSSDALYPHVALADEVHQVTLLHRGYGFLSENAAFSQAAIDAGLRHRARQVAMQVGVICVPGSTGLVSGEAAAPEVAARIGCPVMLKSSTAGRDVFAGVTKRAEVLFKHGGAFLER
ncbi:acetyl-CoA carboxylase [Mycena leptocephala]|nr:acetyl-CoA carboxylase [Mycena leptocephala]